MLYILSDHHGPASPEREPPAPVRKGHALPVPAGVDEIQLSHRWLPTSLSGFNSALYSAFGDSRSLRPLRLSEDLKLSCVLMAPPKLSGFNLSGFLSQSPLTICFPASRMWLTPLICCHLLTRSLCSSGQVCIFFLMPLCPHTGTPENSEGKSICSVCHV